MVIESLLSPFCCEGINTRFSQYEDFGYLTGKVHSMMIIYTCNTSVAIDIEVIEKYFTIFIH